MQRELLRVQQKEHSSIMFVTHSIDEALILGDQIVMIEKRACEACLSGEGAIRGKKSAE